MTIAYTIAFLWAFWGLYALIMGLYRAQLAGRLTTSVRILGAPYLIVGYVVDVLCNVTIAAVCFLELPREPLVTTRLSRYIAHGTGWRYRAALWLCSNLLDPLDPRGAHCTKD